MANIVVPRLWPDSTVVCIATGPSLTREDVDYVRGKARVIAVNDAYRWAPWADVLYSSDRMWWPAHKGVPTFAGMKYGMDGTRAQKRSGLKHCEDVKFLWNTGDTGLELQPDGLKTIWNSGGAAINLAVHFGARRILLLGYNMGIIKGRRHFFGDHLGLNNNSPFKDFIIRFATMAEPLRKTGVTVLNCTANSHLKVFPRAELREALPVSAEVAA